jgi:hypothetical protein
MLLAVFSFALELEDGTSLGVRQFSEPDWPAGKIITLGPGQRYVVVQMRPVTQARHGDGIPDARGIIVVRRIVEYPALVDGAAMSYTTDRLPAAGEEIEIAGARVRVDGVSEGGDGSTVILGSRIRD